ncbi:Uncharacterised protein [Serratia rubidaea]|uniref:Uncharacterized protein n=1 Tax=Serratia rubidaea TaxID=61652 RepID=A0A3S4GE27_SERRU|nr:Uncharacterised protein [Serratia rubidaea]
MLNGAFGVAGQIHLAFIQSPLQIVRRQVDQHHLGGLIEDVVGDGFAHAYAGNAADHVVQALQVLYVDGGQHVDAGIQQLLHILPALGVARAVGVAVGQFIHQDQRRVTRQRGVQIEFAHHAAAVLDPFLRQYAQPVQQRGGFIAAVGFHHPDQNVKAQSALPLGLLQHGVGFADAGAGAEKHLQAAARFFVGDRQQAVRVGALLFIINHGNSLSGNEKGVRRGEPVEKWTSP